MPILPPSANPCDAAHPLCPLPPAPRYAHDAVYLVCNERSGDSTIVALRPADGAMLWSLSTMMAAGAAVPLRDATAAPGLFIYGDTGCARARAGRRPRLLMRGGPPGCASLSSPTAHSMVPLPSPRIHPPCLREPLRRSNITALSAAEGRLLWRLDVTELVNTTGVSTSLTSLELADGGEVLLVRCGGSRPGCKWQGGAGTPAGGCVPRARWLPPSLHSQPSGLLSAPRIPRPSPSAGSTPRD